MPAEEKTEDPTPKRRQEAREEGQVAQSQELSMAFTLLFSFIMLFFLMDNILYESMEFMNKYFTDYMTMTLNLQTFYTLLLELMQFIFRLVAPLMFVVALVGVVVGLLQTGFLFTPTSLQPDPSKLDPVSGFKQIFSKQTVAEFFKSILKISIVGGIAYLTIKDNLPQLIMFSKMGLNQVVSLIGSIIYSLAIKVSLILILLGILDFIYQKWEHEQQLKMTKQEVKEEKKQTEGNPEIKKRQKEKQQEMAMNRMMESVPEADVVITNPTHIAVAIKFDIDNMDAPIVVAKGKGEIAHKIKKKAEECGIEIVEEKPLARALYGQVEIEEEIPMELYQAVAEILAYVYQLNDERRY
ncbi:flagellar biosynthesis protein FlhB [Acetohalobium arabaticum]|uniref:Flagellar biosynthetic protein FlhB n=1 Tax=Acetohalobium arabaticum (strain ATCC 49924 / DSM 5501 / Z-7288) TaxID=574087 RepID=D9QRJ0_ACEAZ|nr:flagellar biosynthesis protein FlhB [Acetohalobium arabaticum]ADL13131.1 flagellar biosynthetic protein FlhB [Acetohalobium arabaticum DSM 5501]